MGALSEELPFLRKQWCEKLPDFLFYNYQIALPHSGQNFTLAGIICLQCGQVGV